MLGNKLILLGIVGAMALGCNPPTRAGFDASTDPPSVCITIGVPCTFAPGKLGICIEVEPTSGPSRLVCQSQH